MICYDDAVSWIHSRRRFQKSPGQERMKALLSRLGNPENELQFIHIAGTNGKGSTAAFTERILRESGMLTGLFTSPYLKYINERFMINGIPVSDDKLASAAEEVRMAVEQCEEAGIAPATEFEVVTAIAMCLFARAGCEIVVLECGIGGAHDSTNVIPAPLVSIITSISLDHTQMLGSTTSAIAAEKAGIMKYPAPLITPDSQDPAALTVLQDKAETAGIRLIKAVTPRIITADITGTVFSLYGRNWSILLHGPYQTVNASCAVTCCKLLGIDDTVIDRGLKSTIWPGRFQLAGPSLVIDCCHNPGGMQSLLDSLYYYFPGMRFHFCMSIMKDKDYETCIEMISSAADHFTAVGLEMPRAMHPVDMAWEANVGCERVDHVDSLAQVLFTPYEEKELRIICGSVYLAGEALRLLDNAGKTD